jgi:hypothetical protein
MNYFHTTLLIIRIYPKNSQQYGPTNRTWNIHFHDKREAI